MNAKTRKALKRILEGRNRAGGDARVERHSDRRHAAKDARARTKFPKLRKHTPHHHELRDSHGAFTWTGRVTLTAHNDDGSLIESMPVRRQWLAGISAQRGF